jgi:hypothetical protein
VEVVEAVILGVEKDGANYILPPIIQRGYIPKW